MIVSMMVMTDDGELFAMGRIAFEPDKGIHWEDLHKLYQRLRADLAIKIKKAEELYEKNN